MKKVEEMMHNKNNIRNISVIAHVDHGKSTLTDTLVVKAKIAAQDGSSDRYMDTRKDEQERGITIKSTAISLHFEMDEKILSAHMEQKYNGKEFLINLIDSPGHVDFSSEVTAALRVTDGALVVVDCIDGICVQTETVLRQAINERIRPVLVLNKLDRSLLELQAPIDDLATMLRRKVDDFNMKLSELVTENEGFKVDALNPAIGEVSFCSGLQGWGFTLRKFARFYLKRFNMADRVDGEAQICKLFWSSRFSFSSDDPWDMSGKLLKEANPSRNYFLVFVLRPIYKVMDMCLKGQIKEIREYLKLYEVNFEGIELKGEGKPLFKVVMRTWLPAADILFEQIVLKLPSPLTSQKYRSDLLYTGPKDNCYTAIHDCDTSEEAPLMMFISKMVPFTDSRFIALGRVFSGNISAGMKIKIQGPDYVPGTNSNDFQYKTVQRVVVMMGRTTKEVSNCPAGNIIGLIGIDQALKKTGTITTCDTAFNIVSMKFSVSPVVKYSVRPKNPIDLPKLKDGLLKLAKSDPLCVVNCMDNGELTVAGAGELHLEICLQDLKNEYANVEILVDEPMVTYLEGVGESITKPEMSKSANKHNRIYMTIEPLEESLIQNFENEKLVIRDVKERCLQFKEVMDIKEDWVKKLMFYGPMDVGPNIMVDETKGVAHLHEIKDHLKAAFQQLTMNGPLIGEPLRGVRFNLTDCVLHTDAIHRTVPQILSPTVQVCSGLILAAEPILYEPIFKIEVSVNNDHVGAVNGVLSARRGMMTNLLSEGSHRSIVIGTLPVRESFGFNHFLMEKTKGKASSTLSFSHYERLPGSMSDTNSIMYQTVTKIREKRKMPPLKEPSYYFDRL